MKKIYQNPDTEIIRVATATPLATSQPKAVEEGFNPNDVPETTETSGNLSRRHNVWDDEIEEEEY